MSPLRAGATYFLLVFGAGFVLGTFRTLLLVPRIGAPTAELLEMPLMLTVIWFSARWLIPRLAPGAALPAGLLALAFALTADIAVGLFLRHLTLAQILYDRPLVPALAYYFSLAIFAILPRLLALR
jgi:hypothetical protein